MPEISKVNAEERRVYQIKFDESASSFLHPDAGPYGTIDQGTLEDIAKKLGLEYRDFLQQLDNGKVFDFKF